MIESGNKQQERVYDTNKVSKLEDNDTISNYYDTVDTISNTISDINDSLIYEIENPMTESIIISNDTISHETFYENISPISEFNNENSSNLGDNDDVKDNNDIEHNDHLKDNNNFQQNTDKTHNNDLNHSNIENKLKVISNPMHSNINIEKYNELQTGDIILCHGEKNDSLIDKAIEYFTHSPWEHAAMVIRDPWWIDSNLEDGLYVFQSGSGPNSYPDVINGSKNGVTLNKLDDFLVNREGVYIRTLNNFNLDGGKKFIFKAAFETSHGKPYDKKPEHWAAACFGSFLKCPCISRKALPRETQEFWCSALVTFMYTKMEWVNSETDWSCKTPNDLMSIKLEKPYSLSEIWKLK